MFKTILKAISLIALSVTATTVQAKALTQDEAKISSAINSFATLADQNAYQHLGRLFAPELTVDYTSLWGGEPTKTTNVELIKQWAGFLPGFDTTYHELSNLDVKLDGDNALATVDFTASHWLGDTGFWSVFGSYEFALNRASNGWVINSVKLNYEGETANRDVLGEAPKFAKQNLLDLRDSKLVTLN
ncbi:nuclear transport factor 2 family protein [Vibrio alginolyticus]|nr:nuclear transport factor 2 family protein [Vibrio alginolyticus]